MGRLTWVNKLLLLMLLLSFTAVAGCGGDSGTSGGEEVAGTPIEAGLPGITLLKPAASGAGEVPSFAWSAVDGAVTYRLVVIDADSKPLWSWAGKETSVNLGGLPDARPADISGPVITPNSSWSVAAFGADGKPVAVSVIRPVSP